MLKFFPREGSGLGIYNLDPVGAVTGSAGNLEKAFASLETLSIPAGNNSGVIDVFLNNIFLARTDSGNEYGEYYQKAAKTHHDGD